MSDKARCMCNRCTVAYDAGVAAERSRIREGVIDYYKVAPKAGLPLLRIVNDEKAVNG